MEIPVCKGNDFGKKEPRERPEKNFSNLSGVMVAASGKLVLIDLIFRSAVMEAFRPI